MRIEINETFRIITDPLNYILQRKHKSRWINEAYHNSLSGIVSTLLARDFRDSSAETLGMALKRNNALVRSLQQALAPLYVVDIRPINAESDERSENEQGDLSTTGV